MQLQSIWSGFSEQQYNYMTDIISNSDAKSICELGTFVGTTAMHVWNSIKDLDKKYELNEIISGDSIFSATGITDGDLVKGIEITGKEYFSETLVTHKNSNTFEVISKKEEII